jgi:hypothetical protein
MPFPLAGILGGSIAARVGSIIGTSGGLGSKFFQNPLIQGGNFGVGYTGGAYAGYGVTNTIDPFNIHKPKYKYYKQNIRMAYGMSGYGSYRRRNYGNRRYRRYGRYSRYRRRSYYRRRYY